MIGAFRKTDLRAFQKSDLLARDRNVTCDNATSNPGPFQWRNDVLNDLTGLFCDVVGSSPSDPSRAYYGLKMLPFQASQVLDGVSAEVQGMWVGSANIPRFVSRGKWKVDIDLKVFYPILAHPTLPAKHWLFLFLLRFEGSSTSFDSTWDLILKTGPNTADVVSPAPAYSNIADVTQALALESSDPTAVVCTWKFDLSAISPTPASPYHFTDYIIVPEVVTYCHPKLAVFWAVMTGNYSETIFRAPPDTGEQHVGLDMSGPALDTGILTNQPGDWIIPTPPAFSGGPVLVVGAPSGADIGFDPLVIESGIAHLMRMDFTQTRIPILHSVFNAVHTGAAFNYQFNDRSLGSPTSWLWTFSDGGTSTLQNPQHTFPGTGIYTVTLQVTNFIGETATHSADIDIPLKASFTLSPGTYPNIAVNGSASLNAASYDWNWGDGSAHGSGATATHSFPAHAGSYTVTLTVSDGHGHTDSTSQTVTIGPVLSANFTSASAASPPHTVQFTDTSTGTIQSWSWQFTHITPFLIVSSSAQSPLMTFAVGGGWITSLTIRDIYGFTSNVSRTVVAP